jgi:hypothetical protein
LRRQTVRGQYRETKAMQQKSRATQKGNLRGYRLEGSPYVFLPVGLGPCPAVECYLKK